METDHRIFFENAAEGMRELNDCSVHLIVTSPPYPCVSMWDSLTNESEPDLIWMRLHVEMERVWRQCERVLAPGGFICINIGDAVRNTDIGFRMFHNAARLSCYMTKCMELLMMPSIIWRKPTNSPNKFMGSGMLPCGAYVTLEHEHILIFRKPGKREFLTDDEKLRRRCSAYFWEERNEWFSDLWEINGTAQMLDTDNTRERSAAYPIEIPFRLINMFSCIGDVVVDPFCGTGTTVAAAMMCGRDSVSFEIDAGMDDVIMKNLCNGDSRDRLNEMISKRYRKHLEFVKKRESDGKKCEYWNERLKAPVVTGQETDMVMRYIKEIKCGKMGDGTVRSWKCDYNMLKTVNMPYNDNALF